MKQIGKRILLKTIPAIFCAWMLLLCSASAETTAKVRGGWLILRSTPSYSGQQISSYPTGTIITITGKNGSWYEVKAPDGLTGYMRASYLTIIGDDLVEGGSAWVTSPNGLGVRLRSGPGTGYAALASYTPGTKGTVLKQYGNFTQIQIGTVTGYMMSRYLTTVDPGSSGGGGGGSETILYDIYVTSANGAGVNLRASAVKGNNVIGVYAVGTKGGMISPGTTWSKVSIDGKTGYMMTIYLTTTKPEETVITGSYIVSANGKSVNLRTGPGMNYTVLASYSPGTAVTVLKAETDWSFVKVAGKYGYMMNQFIFTK